ncbi:MAG TPA: hypothetical protein VEM15_17395 [Thermodesulfobacteriota bacterium]|nr:hypothetical protein [Thermodesulfobacteriota bacterium]
MVQSKAMRETRLKRPHNAIQLEMKEKMPNTAINSTRNNAVFISAKALARAGYFFRSVEKCLRE